MKYKLVLTELAEEHLLKWKKSGQKKTLQKIIKLFEELEEHPYTGTGQVEALKGNLSGYWSRRFLTYDYKSTMWWIFFVVAELVHTLPEHFPLDP